MKKRLLIALCTVAVLLLAALTILRFTSREPQLEGRPLSAWVDDLRRGTPDQRSRAAEVLQRAGPEAAPYLAATIGKQPSRLERFASTAGKHIPDAIKRPVKKVFDPTKQIMDKHAAAHALQIMGTNGHTAIPLLGEMLKDPNVLLSISASRALASMGPEAVDPLIRALDHSNYDVRGAACDGLANLGTNAAPAVPRLIKIIASETGPITASASYALARIGEASVLPLLPLLNDTNAFVRRQAIYTLSILGVNGEAAVPALLRLLDDPNSDVRLGAMDALGRIDPVSRTVSEAALKKLDDSDPRVRSAALQALRYRPRTVRERAGKIAERLEDESWEVQGQAALTLSVVPEQAERWRVQLDRLASASNAVLQANAREALKIIESSRPAVQ